MRTISFGVGEELFSSFALKHPNTFKCRNSKMEIGSLKNSDLICNSISRSVTIWLKLNA
jgi:hypothetical protein